MTHFTTRLTLIAATALLAGCASPALLSGFGSGDTGNETPTAEPTVQLSAKDRLVSALEANGCVLNVDTVGPVMLQASIGQDDIVRLIPELEAEGRAEVASDGEIRLLSPNCI